MATTRALWNGVAALSFGGHSASESKHPQSTQLRVFSGWTPSAAWRLQLAEQGHPTSVGMSTLLFRLTVGMLFR
eukprot:CAMPEP_0185715132 /NCGR_PEP_ID=MMETSP1164-20130828/40220_1 /TAXON_ID=1104430 /ORGANISM="Chrysoreinhardia sp, Strain CCMP2950" /LENGTH=73 /DNA_ID=CAMNT_0028382721 /DNA_START=132 /DNA_END=353 /DNA_ORIENTATION=+